MRSPALIGRISLARERADRTRLPIPACVLTTVAASSMMPLNSSTLS